jgi:subtilisin family serine protease
VRAVERAVAAGIVVVVSAGNHGTNAATGAVGYGGITVPGNAPSAITVGAIDINDTVTRFDDKVQAYSSRGPTWFDAFAKPDIVAPGHRLVGTAARNSSVYRDHSDLRVRANAKSESEDYLRLSGTSMAAAVTSGVIAAGIGNFYHESKHGHLTPNAVKAILHYTAVKLPNQDVLSQGAGALNPLGALRFIREFAKTDRDEWSTTALDPTDVVGGERLVWSQQILWGDQILWGESVVWGNQILWGDSIVWSDTALGVNTATGIVYGNEIEWGEVDPNQVLWMLPPSEGASSTSIVTLSRRDD